MLWALCDWPEFEVDYFFFIPGRNAFTSPDIACQQSHRRFGQHLLRYFCITS